MEGVDWSWKKNRVSERAEEISNVKDFKIPKMEREAGEAGFCGC